MTQNPVEAKRLLRKTLLAKRAIGVKDPSAFTKQLLTLTASLHVKRIGCYLSFGFEPDTQEFIARAEQTGVEVYCPKLDDTQMEFVRWSKNTRKTNLGFEEPSGDSYLGELELVVIPALAVDEAGFRIGRGGGYFDRYLESFAGIKVAVVFDSEVLNALPVESHDVPVNYTVTPTRTIKHG